MRNNIIVKYGIILLFVINSCQNSGQQPNLDTTNIENNNKPGTTAESVPYEIAKRYFVKNTIDKITNPKIENKAEFDSIFGMGTVMGADGKPTKIDFEKQFVIAIDLPITDKSTEINPLSLLKNKNKLLFNYQIKSGEKMSYTIKPHLIIIVDKKYNAELEVMEIKK